MHVAINTLPLETGHRYRGSGTYLRLLLESLHAYEQENTYHEFTSLESIPDNIDCIHYPFFDPFFLTLPGNIRHPFVVTVHDLIPLRYPDHFPPGIRGKIKWLIQEKRLKKAHMLITDSYSSRDDIVNILGFPESQVAVIPLAPDPIFCPIKDDIVIKRYKLPKDFILYVGDVNWNKNIPSLLHAMKNIDIPLVLVGKAFLNATLRETQVINAIIEREKLNDKIIKLGFVDLNELPGIYSIAQLTVCISYVEGFGFPVLESMACGTPCVVSNTSSLKEIAGPSVLVDPSNVSIITEGIKEALKIGKTKKVIEWAGNFTWRKVAEQTTEVYRKVL